MAKTLLAGWAQVPGDRNRMISPTGEVVTYFNYRNQAAQQAGFKSYHEYRSVQKTDPSYNKHLHREAQKLAGEKGISKQKAIREVRRMDSDFHQKYALSKRLAELSDDETWEDIMADADEEYGDFDDYR